MVEPVLEELCLTGQYVEDLELVRRAKSAYCGKAVDANAALRLVLKELGNAESPGCVMRVANNSHLPADELRTARERAGGAFPYATIDARGHIFDAWDSLPQIDRCVFVPGQVESCVTLLRTLLMAPDAETKDSTEVLLRHVGGFLPKGAARVKEKDANDPG